MCYAPTQPSPWHRWKKAFAGLPSQGCGGDASGDSFLAPTNHTNTIYLVIEPKHPNVIPICEPKKKELTFPYLQPIPLLDLCLQQPLGPVPSQR